jgi:hypothetical protein
MKVFDENGDPVEGVFSQEELDAKIAEALKTTNQAPTVPAAAVATPTVPPTPAAPVVDPAIAQLQAQISAIAKNMEVSVTSRFGSNLDADTQAKLQAKFDELSSLPSYDATPSSLERRASDAYTLVTGKPFTHDAMNMGNLGVASGKAPTVANKELKEEDKGLAELLGNTPEDYKKYGNA